MPLTSSIDTSSTFLRLSTVTADNNNSLNNRDTTGAALGPGSYLIRGPRSVFSNTSRVPKTIKASASFATLPRPDVFQHMQTFENEKVQQQRQEEVRKEKNPTRSKKTTSSHGRRQRKRTIPAMEAPSTQMPLIRAKDWYAKYGRRREAEIKQRRHLNKMARNVAREKKARKGRRGVDQTEDASSFGEEEQEGGEGEGESTLEQRNRRIRFELQVIPASAGYLKQLKRKQRKGGDGGGVAAAVDQMNLGVSSMRLFSRDNLVRDEI